MTLNYHECTIEDLVERAKAYDHWLDTVQSQGTQTTDDWVSIIRDLAKLTPAPESEPEVVMEGGMLADDGCLNHMRDPATNCYVCRAGEVDRLKKRVAEQKSISLGQTGYAIHLQKAIEAHCRGEDVDEANENCPHHAKKLNAHRAEAIDGKAGLRALREEIKSLLTIANGTDTTAYTQDRRSAIDGRVAAYRQCLSEIDRLLGAPVEIVEDPEPDDGPLLAFSVDDCGHRYDDALADAVSELCRSELARRAK